MPVRERTRKKDRFEHHLRMCVGPVLNNTRDVLYWWSDLY